MENNVAKRFLHGKFDELLLQKMYFMRTQWPPKLEYRQTVRRRNISSPGQQRSHILLQAITKRIPRQFAALEC